MQHCRSPSSPPGLLPAASAKTGAARRDANGCGRAGSLGILILAVGTEGCLQSQDCGRAQKMQTFLFQQLPWNTQGSILLGFLSSPPSAPFLLLLSASLAFSKGDCHRLSSGPVKGTGQDTKAQRIFMYLDNGGLKGAVSEWSDLAPWLQCNTVVASPVHFLFRKKKLITEVH